ncbi:c-type cytochrome [Marinimicrococcus flavescens]|uniref:C-type cytochrome n=1 Tax=Marinimicrococcus flavescens TaxID=3031815 RepID=A0AAP4D611_9PROT|nr:c-type cytochrome [Marinimicrococcus flavescens]
MRIGIKELVLILAALAAGGLLFAWSGIFNIAASSGHWAITKWFLHYTMHQSVETHAMGIETPPLDDIAMVQRGAGHYATGCAPCHGAPGTERSPVALEMTPHPPTLVPHIEVFEPRELFWIVKNGVKYTGMPAWAGHERDDEVWSVVAFLLRLDELDEAGYRELAHGEAARRGEPLDGPVLAALGGAPPEPLAGCARCHGRDGNGRGTGAFPRLSGQSEAYLLASLLAYARETRNSGIMTPAVSGIGEGELARLAAHYARQAPPDTGSGPAPDEELVEQGRRIARDGVPVDGVPACLSCHGERRRPVYPALAGQHADYLAGQLRLFRDGGRGGTPFAHLMETVARRLDDGQIEAVSAFLASLPPEHATP